MQTKLKLFFAVFIVSWSSILIRWMGPLDPLVISFYRLLFSALILIPFANPFRIRKIQFPKSFAKPFRIRKIQPPEPFVKPPGFHNTSIPVTPFADLTEFTELNQSSSGIPIISHWPLLASAGLLLALHFYTWIASLQITTVARSIFLESTHPIFAVILSALFLKEKAPKAFLPALFLGLSGMYLTVHQDIVIGHPALFGDGLALFSAFCMAAYLIIARRIGNDIPLLRYLFFVYSTAALFILLVILYKGIPFWNMSATVWGLLLLLSAGPNLTGHSLLNWASRRMPVYLVNMALLLESVLASTMAVIFLSEIPDTLFVVGALLILSSIGWVFLSGKTE